MWHTVLNACREKDHLPNARNMRCTFSLFAFQLFICAANKNFIAQQWNAYIAAFVTIDSLKHEQHGDRDVDADDDGIINYKGTIQQMSNVEPVCD